MRTKIIALLFLSVILLALISYSSKFEIAPEGFMPSTRQVLLLTPVGFVQNFFTEPDPVWRQVYTLPANRTVNILDLNVAIFYLLLVASSGTALWFLRRL